MNLLMILGVAVPVLTLAPVAGLALRAVRNKSGKKKAASQFPQLAARLGLTFEQSRDFDEVGEISGAYRGYEVALRPDFFGSMRVTPRGRYAIDLDTKPPTERPEDGMTQFTLGHGPFERFFSQRYAAPEVVQAMHGAPMLRDQLVAFCGKYESKLTNLKIDEYGAVAYVDEAHAYDAALIAGLVDDLVNLACTLDQSLGHCHKRDDDW